MNELVTNAGQAQRHVDVDSLGARHTGLTHAARYNGRVRSLAAAARQNALGSEEPVNILGPGLLAHENDLLATTAELFGQVSIEDAFA